MPERVEARAPTRIDLAGGTIDLWPLCLLHERPLTVNVAIDLYARAVVERSAEPGVRVASHDRGAEARFATPADLARDPASAGSDLEYPVRLTAHFLGAAAGPAAARGGAGCRVTTDCQAPAGSGLGGSSTLGIALAAALDRFTGRGLPPDPLLAVARSIETQVLRIPTGEQDYHPALRGGLLALHYTVEGTRAERLPVDLAALSARLVLVDTGRSRSSGLSNWDMLKRHLDGDRPVHRALDEVIAAAHGVREALLAGDWAAAGAAVGREWEARKRLSPLVTSERIDALIAAGRAAGAVAGKVCGAGGGGCLVLWAPEGVREAIRERVAGMGGRVLDVHCVGQGVEVTER